MLLLDSYQVYTVRRTLGNTTYGQVAYHWRLQTDVLALFPHNERDPAMQSLRQLASGSLGRTALFLLGDAQEPAARAATRTLGTWMAASPLFETVQWDYSHTQHARQRLLLHKAFDSKIEAKFKAARHS